MARLLSALALLCAVLHSPGVWAQADVTGTVDLRAVAADGERSYLNGGLGDLRFDSGHDGLRLGYLRLGFTDDFAQIVHLSVQAYAWGDHDRSPIDLTEAALEIRPFPTTLWRSRWRIGAFYPPVSLENRMEGWRSPYSLSPSALNSWIGEELRTLGVEYDLDWLGHQAGYPWEFGATLGAYSWNETAGALLALRGWAIDDRQSTLFGRIGRPGAFVDLREFYRYPGQRVGYYTGATAKYRDQWVLQGLHYDNRSDPSNYAATLDQYAWHTTFDSVGARWTPARDWTLISQWLGGSTCTDEAPFCWHFHAAFLLASWQQGANRYTARADWFAVHQLEETDEGFLNGNSGEAVTVAYEREFGDSWSVVLEGLQIHSRLLARATLGVPVVATEREVQLALRYEW